MPRLCLLLLLPLALCAQDHHDWKSVSGLTPGDKVKVSLKTGKSVTGPFASRTLDGATIGATLLRRDDVKKVERLKGGGRLKHAAIGAAIGFGGGFAAGAAVGGCRPNDFICIGRGTAGAAVGGVGLLIGGIIGAALPAHRKQLIYEVP